MTNNKTITFGSVCSGIEAASVAWHPLGWRAAWLAEIEPFPCAVLAHHYPDVPNLGNMLRIPEMLRNGDITPPDVFTGGTPCQAFSLAGLRNSLDDARGNLSLTFCEIANEIDIQRSANGLLPCVVKWENVPGVLSTKDNAFGYFLAGLAGEDDPLVAPGGKWTDAGCVYGPQRAVAWRVTDAQFFGVPQRRRRVFVVASARDGFDPAAVLFEFDGVRRDSAPSRSAGKEIAGTLNARTDGGGFPGTDEACSGYGLHVATAGWPAEVASTLNAAFVQKLGLENQHINSGAPLFVPHPVALAVALRGSEGGGTAELGDELAMCLRASTGGGDKPHVLAPIAFTCKDYGADATVELAPTMRAMGHQGSHANAGGQLAVCVTGDITHTLKAEGFDASEDGTGRGQPIVPANAIYQDSEFGIQEYPTAGTLRAGRKPFHQMSVHGMAVRRLTPRECARLQGFPEIHVIAKVGVCFSDHSASFAPADNPNPKSHSDALRASDEPLNAPALTAPLCSSANLADHDKRAVLHVRLRCGTLEVLLPNAPKSNFNASNAAEKSWFPLPMPPDGFALALAPTLSCLARTPLLGKVDYLASVSSSIHRHHGDMPFSLSGAEIVEYASGASAAISTAKRLSMSITSPGGLSSPTCEPDLKTWFSCVAGVIVGSIPSEMRPVNSFTLLLETQSEYLDITVRGKPAADGPKYKALGNSWAVPNVRWIGARIDRALRAGE